MPVLKRLATRETNDPDPRDPWTWVYGNGQDTLPGWPGYRTATAAQRAWKTVARVAMWDLETVGRVPAAATHFDGITSFGVQAASQFWQQTPYRSDLVLLAIEGDRATVAAFRSKQPAAAKTIAAHLDQYLATLDQLAEDAQAFKDMNPLHRHSPYRLRGTYGGPTE